MGAGGLVLQPDFVILLVRGTGNVDGHRVMIISWWASEDHAVASMAGGGRSTPRQCRGPDRERAGRGSPRLRRQAENPQGDDRWDGAGGGVLREAAAQRCDVAVRSLG